MRGLLEPGRDRWRWPGSRVRVRGLAEIVETLDEHGSLDGLPFMPEMVPLTASVFTVYRTADAVCVDGDEALRDLSDTVLLEGLRCDGSAHDGCQRRCLMMWKTAWLEPAPDAVGAAPGAPPHKEVSIAQLRTFEDDRYFCQATELSEATHPLSRWDVRPLFRGLRRGDIDPPRFLRVVVLTLANKLLLTLGFKGIGRPAGTQKSTSHGDLELEKGELVQVKSKTELRSVLTPDGHTTGLSFEYEMLTRCGDVCEVAYPIEKIILETTGKMQRLSNSVVLDRVTCEGLMRRNCPRANDLYWREAWLKRIADC